MSQRQLIVVDPGHFHAALVQKEMYAGIDPRAVVCAPLGADLLDYLARIARFNADPPQPTHWSLEVHAGEDFLDRLREVPRGGIAVFSGRNRGKIDRIAAALDLGLHVLADKPVIIRREDLPTLRSSLAAARRERLVFCDMMTGRWDIVSDLLRALRRDPEIYGDQLAGTRNKPGVALASVHHLMKRVAGVPNPRPAWYFDVAEQGEGLADIGTHLVDRAHRTLFPDMALELGEISVESAESWPTPVTLAEFRQLTGAAHWPGFLENRVRGDTLEYWCNGRASYRVRGVEVGIEVRWAWEPAAGGGDSHTAAYCGSRARLELRQGAAERWRPEIWLVPNAEIGRALHLRVEALQDRYPGLAVERLGADWHVIVPEALRIGHEAHFAMLTRSVVEHVRQSRPLPVWEAPNMLARYYVTTESVAIARRRPAPETRL